APRVAVVGRGDPEPPGDPGALDRRQQAVDPRDHVLLVRAHGPAVVDDQQDRDGLGRGQVAVSVAAIPVSVADVPVAGLPVVAHTTAAAAQAGVTKGAAPKLAAV